MANTEEDSITYVIVVNGTELETRILFCEHFPNFRGGARPETLIPYSSVPCELNEIESALAWITKNLTGSYSDICIGIGIYSIRNWANFAVPHQIIELAEKYQADLKISFSSPVQKNNNESPGKPNKCIWTHPASSE